MYILMHLADRDWDVEPYMLFLEEKALAEVFPRMQEDFKRAAGECSPNGGLLTGMAFISLEHVYQIDWDSDHLESLKELKEQLEDRRIIPMEKIPACIKHVRKDSITLHVSKGHVEWSVRLRGEGRPRYTESVTITSK